MDTQFEHALLPKANHDEQARQNFVKSLKVHINQHLRPRVENAYEHSAKPRFEAEQGRSPQTRHEVRQSMEAESAYQWWSVLRRTAQELLWESVQSSIERQLPALKQQAQQYQPALGSLILNPDFEVPTYQKAIDIHCMPGSYHTDAGADDLSAGALYDRGVYLYALGWLGPLNDDLGQSLVHYHLKTELPEWQPKRILDMGCSVGHSTVPYAEAYPNAEVHGIDVAAPMLRYAHARAEALGQRVHFSQQNAEQTQFADGSFDLVVSHILLHEMPVFAIRNVLKESYRLLAPGGRMIHLEGALYQNMDPFRAFLYDWETTNNNEPFWSAMRDLDLPQLASEAGFSTDQIEVKFIPNGVWKEKITAQTQSEVNRKPGIGSRGTWLILSACK